MLPKNAALFSSNIDGVAIVLASSTRSAATLLL
jgi:hypothetical protein